MNNLTVQQLCGISDDRTDVLIHELSDLLEGKKKAEATQALIEYLKTSEWAVNEILWAGMCIRSMI